MRKIPKFKGLDDFEGNGEDSKMKSYKKGDFSVGVSLEELRKRPVEIYSEAEKTILKMLKESG